MASVGTVPRYGAVIAMNDDTSPVTRRNVLAGLGALGVGGTLVGAGTAALFSDEKTLPNDLVAGELSLVLDWQESYDFGEGLTPIDAFPDPDNDGVQNRSYFEKKVCSKFNEIDSPLESGYRTNNKYTDPGDPLINLGDIKPGDRGEVTLSYHLCDNDGWVWFRTLDVDVPAPGQSPHLADAMQARVWHDMYENEDTHAGDNKYQEGKEPVITQGPLRSVLEDLEHGVRLDGDPRHFRPRLRRTRQSAHRTSLEKGTVLEFDGQGVIRSRSRSPAPPELAWLKLTGFSLGGTTPTDGICQVDVKNHKSTLETKHQCEHSGTAVGKRGILGARLPLKYFRFHYCQEADHEPHCVTASNTQYIGFEWWLPKEVGNAIQEDNLSFDMQFYTEQCRHNSGSIKPVCDNG
ncbi:MAG: SipW-dependent-type signal peptide-containing protein [Natrialbaceae archaeon]|nr:SipW-dependent-type signal peptide-containing protein [Natrialbaceae archaeon]